MNRNIYYTYAWLREDGTPYYIGKGKGGRAYVNGGRNVKTPPKDRILLLKKNLTEEEAFKHEIYMIHVLGRKDLGTGILRNLTNGGEGISGLIHSEKTKRKLRGRIVTQETRKILSEKCSGWKHSEEAKEKIRQHTLNNPPCPNGHRPESIEKMRLAKSGSNHPNYGKPRSDSIKEKISLAQRGKKRDPNIRSANYHYRCLVSGKVSTGGGLTKIQRRLGIDTSLRELVDETNN
jgi:hypothetical protein